MAVHEADDCQSHDAERDERGARILGVVMAILLAIIVALSVYVILPNSGLQD